MQIEDLVDGIMEFKFDSNLEFQLDAIKAMIDLFKGQGKEGKIFVDAVIANSLTSSDKNIYENLVEIQKRNKLNEAQKLGSMDFSVEMETGTGKTYVYLRTIFELNQKYGFKKFIIVVHSVAIREGVLKSLNITKEHFRQIYDNISYNFYEYDSSKLNKIRQFARNNSLEIMVMTIDSFNKDTTIMNKSVDKLSGEKPIDLVRRTRPILILDEPQNMETEIRKKAIANLDPLFKLRYSATHKEYYNLVYRLTPFEAYSKNLVKKIEVLSVTKKNDFNSVLIHCDDVVADSKGLYAILRLNKKQRTGYKQVAIKINKDDNIEKKTGNGDYKDFKITKIDARYGMVEFSNGLTLTKGQGTGEDKEETMRLQIRHTIEEHFRKAKELRPFGLKVLSLFFIDRVASYKEADGYIRKTFLEEFENSEERKKVEEFKDLDINKVHNGYFSEYKSESGMESDKGAFDLIMRDKERLLSFSEPTQFIFTHSALREGWDNPNVFNICVLRELGTEISRRQTIGRGMRLPVNQEGERIIDYNINRLTVVASESYIDYCKRLQQEYERDGFIEIPPNPPDARNRKTVSLKKGFALNPDFKELWSRISKRTKYAVNIDTKDLIGKCSVQIGNVDIKPVEYRIVRAAVNLEKNKVSSAPTAEESQEVAATWEIPNILGLLSDETNLTRNTIYDIFKNSKRLDSIFRNPRDYIDTATKRINAVLADYLINGIKYIEIGERWEMSLFQDLITYEEHVYPVRNSIYEEIVFDVGSEKTFAQKLNDDPRIKLFIKLPSWFTVETPIGTYNPDWAIVFEDAKISTEKKNKLYLVRETKFVEDIENLRPSEKSKIKCAEEHFKTIKVNFKTIKSYDELI